MKREQGVSRMAAIHALIAEDDALIALDIEQTLASHFGLRLSVVHGLKEGLRLASGDRPDIAILDLVLRGESVEPLARLLAADGVPILFVSGYRSHPLAHLADGLMLEKPYTSEKLVEFVDLALRRLAR